jgi:transketolase C-terminal domain/subunit
LGIPDVFAEKYGSQDIIMEEFGLDPENIVKIVKNCLTKKIK